MKKQTVAASLAIKAIRLWAIGIFAFCLIQDIRAQTLSLITLFSTDASGSEEGFQYWDTRPDPNGLFDLWLVPGLPGGTPDGFTGSFLNGPSGSQVPVSLTLQPGANRFTSMSDASTREPPPSVLRT